MCWQRAQKRNESRVLFGYEVNLKVLPVAVSEESNCWRSFFLEPLFGSAPRSIRNPRRPLDLEFNVYLAISVDPDNEMGTRLISYVRQRPKEHYESPLLSESGIQRLRVAVFGGSHFRGGVFWSIFGSAPPSPTHNATTVVSGSEIPLLLVCFVMDPDFAGAFAVVL